MNFLAVTGRVRSDLGSFLPRAARAFEVFTNLLASGAGCVEVFLCISLDLRSTAPPCRNFVTKLSTIWLRNYDRAERCSGDQGIYTGIPRRIQPPKPANS